MGIVCLSTYFKLPTYLLLCYSLIFLFTDSFINFQNTLLILIFINNIWCCYLWCNFLDTSITEKVKEQQKYQPRVVADVASVGKDIKCNITLLWLKSHMTSRGVFPGGNLGFKMKTEIQNRVWWMRQQKTKSQREDHL